jgi:hypothetical protein
MKFLKLTNIILNVQHINKISIKPNKYYINYGNKIDGSGWLFALSGLWNIVSGEEIEICKMKNPQDYDTLTQIFENINKS